MLAEVLYIGDRLRDLRKRRLLTQEQLAERSGVGIATIVRVERNQVEPRGSTIRKLAEALRVEPEVLVKVWRTRYWYDEEQYERRRGRVSARTRRRSPATGVRTSGRTGRDVTSAGRTKMTPVTSCGKPGATRSAGSSSTRTT